MNDLVLGVSEAVDLINLALDQTMPAILIEGEVSSFKINQNKFVFFDIKDESSTLGCFMMLFQLKYPLEDGMRVKILAQPKLTKWGRFSLTVKEIVPVGEGSLKKSFEILKKRLESEGLFDESRKQKITKYPKRVGVVSSSSSAGFKDFIKILDNRWGGLDIFLADVTVQGLESPGQIVKAIDYLNELSQPLDVIVVIRGGGSLDDLSTFNHEDVVRAVALSRTPTIVGVGHDVDISLADLAADVRAATPSNAAEILVQDKNLVLEQSHLKVTSIQKLVLKLADERLEYIKGINQSIYNAFDQILDSIETQLKAIRRTLRQLDPSLILKKGYAVVIKNQKVIKSVKSVTIKDRLNIEVSDGNIFTEVIDVSKK